MHELEDGLIGVYAQGPWLTVTTHGLPSGAEALKTSFISWSSSCIKRRVSFNADAVTLSSVAAETEWLQLFCWDVAMAGLKVTDWQQNAPLTVVLGNSYELRARQVRSHVVDAGFLYDVVSKECQDSKQDGVTAMGLEASAQSMKGASRLDDMTFGPHHPGRCDDQGRPWQAWVRWLSKRATLVKAMIKADPGRLNDALMNVRQWNWQTHFVRVANRRRIHAIPRGQSSPADTPKASPPSEPPRHFARNGGSQGARRRLRSQSAAGIRVPQPARQQDKHKAWQEEAITLEDPELVTWASKLC